MESQDMPEPESPEPDSVTAWFKSLRRSTSDRLLTGVAGGLAERLGVPSLIVRAAFVLAALAGFGIPVYLIAWALVPTDRGQRLTDGGGMRDLIALAVVVISGLMLTGQVAGFSTSDLIWRSLPWALMLIGVALVLRRRESDKPDAAHSIDPSGVPNIGEGADNPAGASSAARMTAVRRAIGPPSFPVVGLLTWCLVLVICSAMGALALAGVFEFGPGVFGAVALVVFGAGLVFSAFRGKARGLILPALTLVAVFAGLGAIDLRVDNLDGAFDLTVADAAELPSELRTSLSDSYLNMVNLELNSDRFLRIDQTAGTLTVVLPADVNVKLDLHIGLGDGSITRPDRENAISLDPGLARAWLRTGVPRAGDPVDSSLYSSSSDYSLRDSWWGPTSNLSSGIDTHHERTVDQGGDHTLVLEIHMGAGSVRLIDPHWSKSPLRELSAPTQLCTVGGGERGVVKPCGDVPVATRVALCINENLFLVDCREDRQATADYPRVPACRGFFGDEVDCAEVEIEPVGAQLATPGLSSDDELDGTIDPAAPPSTIRLPDPPETTLPAETNSPEPVGGRS